MSTEPTPIQSRTKLRTLDAANSVSRIVLNMDSRDSARDIKNLRRAQERLEQQIARLIYEYGG